MVKKNLSCLMHMLPAEVKQDGALPPCFSSHTMNKCPLFGLFSTMVFYFYIFMLFVGNFAVLNVPQA